MYQAIAPRLLPTVKRILAAIAAVAAVVSVAAPADAIEAWRLHTSDQAKALVAGYESRGYRCTDDYRRAATVAVYDTERRAEATLAEKARSFAGSADYAVRSWCSLAGDGIITVGHYRTYNARGGSHAWLLAYGQYPVIRSVAPSRSASVLCGLLVGETVHMDGAVLDADYTRVADALLPGTRGPWDPAVNVSDGIDGTGGCTLNLRYDG